MAEENCSTGFLPNIPKDVLQDLCSRFLINIPENEKTNLVRICFQIELAHWYYIDFCRQDDPDLPVCGMKAFIFIIFNEFEFLNKTKQSIQTIYDNWKQYKVRVPVFGAILLDEDLERCLLVQGYHNKTSWGFPKGKVNKDEGDLNCAIREVWEETGYDISPLAKPDQFLENTIHDHQIRLYIVAGIEKNFDFKPNTRGEIKEIRWFPIQHLPTHKKDLAPKEEFGLLANNFFMIHTFIKPLRKWIQDKQDSMTSFKSSYSLFGSFSKSRKTSSDEYTADPLLMKLRKQEEAEKFKKQHMLMNPLHSHQESENTLKSLLGLNVNKAEKCSSGYQPEAIRKLLNGSLDVSPHRDNKKINFRPRNIGPRFLPSNNQQNEFSAVVANESLSHYNTSSQAINKHQNKKIPIEIENESVSYQWESISRVQQQDLRNQKVHTPYKIMHQSGIKRDSPHVRKLSDFTFKSPAFSNFKFDYKDILLALSQV